MVPQKRIFALNDPDEITRNILASKVMHSTMMTLRLTELIRFKCARSSFEVMTTPGDYCKKGAHVDCCEVNATEGECRDLTERERKTKFRKIKAIYMYISKNNSSDR